MSKNTGGPAFPFPVLHGRNAPEGMTLRDYFAAKAMQAAATNETWANGFTFGQLAEWAYMQADAMLAERKK